MNKLMVGVLLLVLAGCTTLDLSASKSVAFAVAPGESSVFVRADAHVICKDYVFYHPCNLVVDAQRVKGE